MNEVCGVMTTDPELHRPWVHSAALHSWTGADLRARRTSGAALGFDCRADDAPRSNARGYTGADAQMPVASYSQSSDGAVAGWQQGCEAKGAQAKVFPHSRWASDADPSGSARAFPAPRLFAQAHPSTPAEDSHPEAAAEDVVRASGHSKLARTSTPSPGPHPADKAHS